MNNNYDVYMCRVRDGSIKGISELSMDLLAAIEKLDNLAGMSEPERRDSMWSAFSNKVAKYGFLKRDSNGKLVRGGK